MLIFVATFTQQLEFHREGVVFSPWYICIASSANTWKANAICIFLVPKARGKSEERQERLGKKAGCTYIQFTEGLSLTVPVIL